MAVSKSEAVRLGARGAILDTDGLRPETFAFLNGGGVPAKNLPVTITCYPDGSRRVTDGRHRLILARKRGEAFIEGVIVSMGQRGGVRVIYRGKFPTGYSKGDK